MIFKSIPPTRLLSLLFIFITLLSSHQKLGAQDLPDTPEPSDTLDATLEGIQIEATRKTQTVQSSPASINIKNRSEDEIRFEPGLSLDKVIGDMPGIFVTNRENYALGESVSIRGMGWRAAFGVRGINVLLDGIPLTVPDGQTTLDIIDPAFIRDAELIRGPNSTFWGNASGGTLFLRTQDEEESPKASFRTFAGSHELFKAEAQTTIPFGDHSAQVFASFVDREGYREHSHFRSTRIGGNASFSLDTDTDVFINASYVNSPKVFHPGYLNLEDFRENPRQADPQFVEAGAGKTWEQGQFGFNLSHNTSIGTIEGTFYGIRRELNNPLTFADIELDRSLGGTRFSIRNDEQFLNFGFGVDAALQRDDRLNWNYDDDFDRDELTLDQRETVTNLAGFATTSTSWDYFNISGGVRYDYLYFDNNDFLQTDGIDQSGDRTFTSLSPSLGVSLNYNNQVWFANYSTSFESPTTTELVNRPDMTGGFNPDLKPERTRGYETGIRGGLINAAIQYDFAGFLMQVNDRLIPFQTEEGGDRDFYRNQNSTTHRGFEGVITLQPHSAIRTRAGYNYSRFQFNVEDPDTPDQEITDPGEDPAIDGNLLPGIPEHRFFGNIRWMPGSWWISVDVDYVGGYFVNDQNSIANDAYTLIDLEIGHRGLPFTENMIVQPFLKIDNLTNQTYSGSVNINADSFIDDVEQRRYFEAGAGITVNAGFTISFEQLNS